MDERWLEEILVDLRIDGKTCGCQQCIETTLRSLRGAVVDADAERLLLPSLCGLGKVVLE